MRAHVLPDARLVKLSGRFVRLEVDTEKPGNAAFVEKFPIDAWPTLYVIDPATETVAVRWAGTATAEQIAALAQDGERAIHAGHASRADAALARADRLLGERRHADAAAAFVEALDAGGPRWSSRERALEARVQALAFAGDSAACAAAARDALGKLPPGGRFARVAAQGLTAALELDGDARVAELDRLEPPARRAIGMPGVLADDRSGLYEALVSARDVRGDEAGAMAVARKWLAFLEGEAARAPTPLARSGFDGQRLSAALRLGAPERVIPALRASERDLPGEFAPAAYLASAYLALQKPRDALAAAERALARAEGPRRVRVLVLKARALDGLGDRDGARSAVDEALRLGASFPEGLRPASAIRGAEAFRRELDRTERGG